MNILITRPSPHGNYLTNQLNIIGKKAWHLPLISFSEGKDLPLLNKKINTLLDNDLLFIMSQTAIYYAHIQLTKLHIPWPKNLYYYAIGHTTALRTYKYTGMKSNYPKIQETSEELLQLIELNRDNIEGKRALILCGNTGRKILQKTLQKRNVQVIICESYSHIPIFYNGKKQTQYMIKLGINVIVITSIEILKQLYNLVPNYYRKNWLLNCKIVTISHRIANYAISLGWENIIITKTIKNNDLINLLLKI